LIKGDKEGFTLLRYKPELRTYSRELRSDQIDAERRLWARLRRKQINGLLFTRQKPIGPHIVDFYCHRAKLVIEVDGSQHQEAANMKKDENRDAYLKSLGLNVLRFDDYDVLTNIEGVVFKVLEFSGKQES